MHGWNLRDLGDRLIGGWLQALILLILGGMVGLGINTLLPAPYRAAGELYVGIDLTRVNEMEYLIPLAKQEPLNLDDYKNWQLKQVAAVLSSDPVLNRALELLEDEKYQLDLVDFRKMLDLYWYDTGIWRLEVTHRDQDLARAGAEAWLRAGHDEISVLLDFGEVAASLDARLFALADEIGLLQGRTARLATFLEQTQDWQDVLESQPGNEPLSDDLLQELQAWILVYRKDPRYWQIPVGELPGADDPADLYLPWLAAARLAAEADLNASQSQLEILSRERDQVLPEYHQALDDSLGLSANLVLEPNSSLIPIEPVRTPGPMVLGGSLVGLVVWLILAVAEIQRRGS